MTCIYMSYIYNHQRDCERHIVVAGGVGWVGGGAIQLYNINIYHTSIASPGCT